MSQRQVNVRLEADIVDVLAAAAFIDGVSTGELLRPYLRSLADELARDPQVMAAVRARRERAAIHEGKLQNLSKPRAGRSGRTDA